MAEQYRYSLRRDNLTYYRIKDGKVDTQAYPYYFYEGIDSFKDLGISNIRNMRMSGFFRAISQKEYRFVGYLKDIVRYIAMTQGVQATVILRVDKISSYKDKTYSLDYECELNMSTGSRERDQFPVELLQGGVEELLKSKEDTDFNIWDANDYITIAIQPMLARGRAVYVTISAPGQSGHGPNRLAKKINWPGYAQMQETVIEVLESPNYRPVDYFAPLAEGVSEVVEFGQLYNELSALGNFEGYVLRSNVRLEKVILDFSLPVYVKNLDALPVSFRLRIYQADAGAPANWVQLAESASIFTVGAGLDDTHTFSIDTDFPLDANKVMHIVMENLTPSVTNVEWQYESEVPLKIDFEHYTSAFEVKAKKWKSAGEKILSKSVGNAATFKSNLLTQDISYKDGINCKPANLALLSSDTIKGITTPKMLISWSNYLLATDAMLCAGCGIERDYDADNNVTATRVALEKRSEFFKEIVNGSENLIADLGETAKDPTQSVQFIQEEFYNEIHIGYRETDTDDLNGPDDPHTVLKMSTPYTKVKQVKPLISPVSASGMAIYRKFIRYATGQDNDTGNDNDLFVLQYDPNPIAPNKYNALYPADIGGAQGAINTQGVRDKYRLLNAGLTPKTCFIRRAYYEIGFFYSNDSSMNPYRFTFNSLDKNQDLILALSNNYAIIEKSDEDLGVLLIVYGQKRLFYPYVINSDHNAPDNVRQLWQSARNGVFSVLIDGNRYTGFPLEMKEKNSSPKLHTFKLLLTAANDPTDLA